VIRNAGKSQVGPYLLHEARVMLPVCYDHAGQWQNEVNAYEDAVREFATDAEVLNAAAWFYAITKSGLHNPGKALEYANRAIAAAPNDPNIVDTLATAYFANGRIADAIATEKKALALAPNRKDLQKDMEEFKQAQRAKQSRNTKQPGTK
jgi:tetratricopeptide (TPR) repeat protein